MLFDLKKQSIKGGVKLSSVEEDLFKKLSCNMDKALKRAEEIKLNENSKLLKKSSPPQPLSNRTASKTEQNDEQTAFDDGISASFSQLRNGASALGGGSFTKDELAVLRHGSNINERNYVPFFPEIDVKERFFFSIPFT